MELDYREILHTRKIRGTEQSESTEDTLFKEMLTEGLHKNVNGPQPNCALHPSDLEVRNDSASTLVTKIEEDRPSTYTRPLEPGRFNNLSSRNRLERCIVQVQRAIERLRPYKM